MMHLVNPAKHTTGATVNECARTLLQFGAERVDVLTLARAI